MLIVTTVLCCRPLEIIVKYLEKQYLARFLESSMYKNYVKELIGTITVSWKSISINIA